MVRGMLARGQQATGEPHRSVAAGSQQLGPERAIRMATARLMQWSCRK